MNSFGVFVYWFSAFIFALSGMLTLTMIGKEREPITGGVAWTTAILQLIFVSLFINAIYGFWF